MSQYTQDIHEAISLMTDARARIFPGRTTDSVINSLAEAAQSWLPEDSPWRQQAIAEAPAANGFTPEMVDAAIDLIFGAVTTEALGELVDRELGNRRVLDEFSLHGRVRTRASGPQLITHILAGNIPAPGIVSICCGLLLRSANLVRVASGDPLIPWLFVESLRAVDPELADCARTLWWPKNDTEATQQALQPANAVIAYGDDNTVKAIRDLTPPQARFLGYGHKVSCAVVGREALTMDTLPAVAENAAFDVSIYDQQGCLSPHMLFVEEGGEVSPRKFAAALAQAMSDYHQRVPSGPLTLEAATQVANLRSGYEFRAKTDRRVTVWGGMESHDWCVIYEDEPTFTPSCLNRLVFVKPTDGYKRILNSIQRFSASISCVGVSPLNERAMGFANDLARIGIHRVCPIGQMQRPPLTWHHDGRPNLAELVHWTDLG